MRKGFTFMEILVIVVIASFVLLIFDGLFRTLLTDIPWSYRIAQENTTLLNMLQQMQQDIDEAKRLPESFTEHTAGDKLLLIELTEGVICYQLKDGRVTRQKLTDFQQGKAEGIRLWSLPHANVEWQVWTQNGQGYAVETNTYVEYKRRGQFRKKMAHSHLYFIGALGKALK